jgi:hypothetical protein
MKMKEQQYFQPEEAAKKLDMTLSELSYQVKEGGIRLAVVVPVFAAKRIIHLENLSKKNRQLCLVSDAYRLLTNWEAYEGSQARNAPRFLYLDVVRTVIRWTEEPPYEFKSMVFETFEGEPVALLDLRGFPEFCYLGPLDDRGIYKDTVLTLEEIERVSVLSDTEPEPGPGPELPPSAISDFSQLGVYEIGRSNPINEILCFYANRFLRDRREIPTWDLFLAYAIDASQSDQLRRIQVDPKKERSIRIGGQWISEASLKRRFDRLTLRN